MLLNLRQAFTSHKTVVLTIGLLAFAGPGIGWTGDMPENFIGKVKFVDDENIRNWLDNERPFVVLDVRTKKEFRNDGRAPDAVLYPYTMNDKKRRDNEEFLRDVSEDFEPDATLVVLCSHGMRATQAAWELEAKAGFTEVYVFAGGYEGHHMPGYPAGDGWKAAGLPLAK